MKTFILLTLAAVAAASPQYEPQEAYGEPFDPPKYEFEYSVRDAASVNDYGQREERDGASTAGSYEVRLPDTRLQRVVYSVDGDSGFIADVEFDGEAQHPEEYGSAPAAKGGYAAPAKSYGAPAPRPTYAAPVEPETSYRPVVSQPKPSYRPAPRAPKTYRPAPSPPKTSYGPAPSQPEVSYGHAPSKPETSYGPAPSQPEVSYGPAPSQPEVSYGPAPSQPEVSYGSAPSKPETSYGQPEVSYGPAPSQPQTSYGPAPTPASYGPAPTPASYGPAPTPASYRPAPSPPKVSYRPAPSSPKPRYRPTTSAPKVSYRPAPTQPTYAPATEAAPTEPSVYGNKKLQFERVPSDVYDKPLFRADYEKAVHSRGGSGGHKKKQEAPARYGPSAVLIGSDDDEYLVPESPALKKLLAAPWVSYRKAVESYLAKEDQAKGGDDAGQVVYAGGRDETHHEPADAAADADAGFGARLSAKRSTAATAEDEYPGY